MCSKPNAKTLRFITKKELICKAAKQGDGEQVSDPPPSREGFRVVRLRGRWLEERKVR